MSDATAVPTEPQPLPQGSRLTVFAYFSDIEQRFIGLRAGCYYSQDNLTALMSFFSVIPCEIDYIGLGTENLGLFIF